MLSTSGSIRKARGGGGGGGGCLAEEGEVPYMTSLSTSENFTQKNRFTNCSDTTNIQIHVQQRRLHITGSSITGLQLSSVRKRSLRNHNMKHITCIASKIDSAKRHTLYTSPSHSTKTQSIAHTPAAHQTAIHDRMQSVHP